MCVHILTRIYWNIMCIHISRMFQLDILPSYICTYNLYKKVLHAMYLSCMYIYISYMLLYCGLRYKSNSQLLWWWKPINKMVNMFVSCTCIFSLYTKSTFPDEFWTSIWGVARRAASWRVAWRAKKVGFASISWLPCVDAVRTARKSPRFSGNCLVDLTLIIW